MCTRIFHNPVTSIVDRCMLKDHVRLNIIIVDYTDKIYNKKFLKCHGNPHHLYTTRVKKC